jgi:hypothetical protein
MNHQGHLEIPKPCHENWLNMSKQEQGRHCGVCCKTVVDFTSMPTEKVIEVISQKKDENICGRFRPDQLNTSRANVSPRNRYRIFMAAIYFVFGGLLFTSCRVNEPKMGKVKVSNSFGQDGNGFNRVDTPSSRTRYKTDQPVQTVPVCNKPVIAAADTIEPEIHMLGEVLYIPIDTTQK